MPTTMKLIGKTALGSAAASIEFTSIPGTYTDLLWVLSLRSDGAVRQAVPMLTINGSTSNFSSRNLRGSGSAAASFSYAARAICQANGDSSTSNTFTALEMYFPNYAGSTNKSWTATAAQEDNQTEAYIDLQAGLWSNTSAITSLSVSVLAGGGSNWKTGSSAYLYGITKA